MATPMPLLDYFRRGEVAADVRLLAARGVLAPRGEEQLAILVQLADDPDDEVRAAARDTIDRLPSVRLRGHLARAGVPDVVRAFFLARGITPAEGGDDDDGPLIEAAADGEGDGDGLADESGRSAPAAALPERQGLAARVARMGVAERLRAAMKGSREVRTLLIRDPNRMVAAAVLCSPRVTEPEIEGFARMTNVGEEVLRTIGNHRAWTRSYAVVAALVRNARTPVAISLNLMARLNDRDVVQLANDRNVPEALRSAARRKAATASRR